MRNRLIFNERLKNHLANVIWRGSKGTCVESRKYLNGNCEKVVFAVTILMETGLWVKLPSLYSLFVLCYSLGPECFNLRPEGKELLTHSTNSAKCKALMFNDECYAFPVHKLLELPRQSLVNPPSLVLWCTWPDPHMISSTHHALDTITGSEACLKF